MRLMRTVALLLTLTGSFLAAQTSETIPFRAVLLPSNEVPAININASGAATIWLHVVRDAQGQVTSASTDFNVTYQFPGEVRITGLHIHKERAGQNGPVTIDSGIRAADPVVDTAGRGTINRQGFTASSNTAGLDTVNGMLVDPSGFYANLHTTVNPGGVIRGQLQRAEMKVLMTELSPRNENPPIDTPASGIGSIIALATRDSAGNLTSGQVIFDANYTGFAEGTSFTGFHIHDGLPADNGPVTINTGITAANSVPANPSGGNLHYEVEVPMNSPGAVKTLGALYTAPSTQYMNLHTVVNPGGVIRGQLRNTDALRFPVTMLPSNEVPPVNIDASAPGAFTLHSIRNAEGAVIGGAAIFDVNYRFPGETTFTGLHIHNGKAGENGPVTIDSGLRAASPIVSADGAGNIYRIVNVSTAAGLATANSVVATPENQYINLHTTVNPGGVVRSQLASASASAPRVDAVISSVSDSSLRTVAPGGLMTIFGANLGRGDVGSGFDGTKVPTSFNGTQVSIGGRGAPAVVLTPTYIVAQVPNDTPTGNQPLTVKTPAGTSTAIQVPVATVAPALFFDAEGGLFANSSFQLVGRSGAPARKGQFLTVFSTGLGVLRPAAGGTPGTGTIPMSVYQPEPVTVLVDGRPVTGGETFATPGYLGLYQTTFALPSDVRSGRIPVQLRSGQTTSNSVMLTVE
jgi:uncharacterized protein (TIGR03437 family)